MLRDRNIVDEHRVAHVSTGQTYSLHMLYRTGKSTAKLPNATLKRYLSLNLNKANLRIPSKWSDLLLSCNCTQKCERERCVVACSLIMVRVGCNRKADNAFVHSFVFGSNMSNNEMVVCETGAQLPWPSMCAWIAARSIETAIDKTCKQPLAQIILTICLMVWLSTNTTE